MHDKIFDKLCDILDDMERKEKLSASDVQIIDWATHAKKSMLAVDEMMGDGYSERESYRDNRDSRMSGRGSYARKRDSMGRYSRDGYSRTYSRDGGKEEYVNQLYEMMDNAPDEQSRKNIQKMIREMEQA